MVKRLLLIASLFACVAPAGHARPPARMAGPTIEDLTALVELGTSRDGLALSPNGAYLVATFERRADLERNDYTHSLVLAPTDGGAVRIIGDGGGYLLAASDGRRNGAPIERTPIWSPDSQSIAFIAERNQRAELWRAEIATGRSERMAEFDGPVHAARWLPNGDVLVELGAPYALQHADDVQDAARGYAIDERLAPIFSLSRMPRGEVRHVLLDRAGRIMPVNAARRAALMATANAGLPIVVPVPDAAPVMAPPEELRIVRDGQTLRCTANECQGDIRNPMLMTDGRVAFTRVSGFARTEMSVAIWDPTTGAVQEVRRSDDRLVCVAGGAIYCLREATWRPRELIAIDAADGEVRILHNPNPSWVRHAQSRVERIDFTDPRGGFQSYAHLVYPIGYRRGRTYPLVIVQYRSRGFLRGGTGGEFPIYPYASRGYFVLSIERPDDLVGMTQTGGDRFFAERELNGEENRMKLDALDYFLAEVERRGLVDPERVAITGLSDGSETLYLAVTRRAFAAAVVTSQPTDRNAWWLQSGLYRTQMRRYGATPPWSEVEPWNSWWIANSIPELSTRISTPMLFNASHTEALGAMPLFVRMREHNQPVDMYLYPDAYHLKWRPLQILAAQERGMAWIDFWLRNEVVEDPHDPGRIARWRALREARAAAAASR